MSRLDDLTPETLQRLRDEVPMCRDALYRFLVAKTADPAGLAAAARRADGWAADELFMLDNLAEWSRYFDALERAARCCPFSGPLYYLEQLEAFAAGDPTSPEARRRLRLLRHIVFGEYYCNVVRYGGGAHQAGRKAKWRVLSAGPCGCGATRKAKMLRFVQNIENVLLAFYRSEDGDAVDISMQMWHFRHFISGTLPPTLEEGEKARAAELAASVSA